MFPISLATWTPEIIRYEDVPDSFELFVSYFTEYDALRLIDDDSYEYRGPMDFSEEVVEAAKESDIVQYRRFVSITNPQFFMARE